MKASFARKYGCLYLAERGRRCWPTQRYPVTICQKSAVNPSHPCIGRGGLRAKRRANIKLAANRNKGAICISEKAG